MGVPEVLVVVMAASLSLDNRRGIRAGRAA